MIISLLSQRPVENFSSLAARRPAITSNVRTPPNPRRQIPRYTEDDDDLPLMFSDHSDNDNVHPRMPITPERRGHHHTPEQAQYSKCMLFRTTYNLTNNLLQINNPRSTTSARAASSKKSPERLLLSQATSTLDPSHRRTKLKTPACK